MYLTGYSYGWHGTKRPTQLQPFSDLLCSPSSNHSQFIHQLCLKCISRKQEGTSFIRAMMMEAVCTSETSVYFNETTRCYVPEGCHFHTRHRENVKLHNIWVVSTNRQCHFFLKKWVPERIEWPKIISDGGSFSFRNCTKYASFVWKTSGRIPRHT
jgi:hypothetical protein